MKNNKKPGALPVRFILICTLPALLLTVFFTILPTARALSMSFTDATMLGVSGGRFIGLENYRYMLEDRYFTQALRNTGMLLLAVPAVTIFISLLLAFAVSQGRLREKGFYRTVFFFPSVVSMTVIGIIWSFVFHPNMGILNTLLNGIGLGALARPWVGDSSTALWTVAVTLVWQAAGYYMVMHIAAMDGISAEIYEAAAMDGAGPARRLFFITLPMIWDIVGITFVLALSGTLNNSFVLSRMLTDGGPNGASTVLLQYIYRQGIRSGNYGYAMSITVFTLALAIMLSALARRMTERREAR